MFAFKGFFIFDYFWYQHIDFQLLLCQKRFLVGNICELYERLKRSASLHLNVQPTHF